MKLTEKELKTAWWELLLDIATQAEDYEAIEECLLELMAIDKS